MLPKTISTDVLKRLEGARQSLSFVERVLFAVLAIVFVGSTLLLLGQLNGLLLVEVPAHGGRITEGVVGTPRFINPLLAISDADRDVTALVYSGLLRRNADGSFIPDLASSFEVSDDGRSYTFTLRDTATFHDGTLVTAEDVAFTIARAQDPLLKSPKRANWEGVTVETLDNHTVRFTLTQPYTPFLENTTLGILPAHIWEGADSAQFAFSQFNIEPIGSGPFRVSDIARSDSGIPERYTLSSFNDYALGQPYIDELVLYFFANENDSLDAYERGTVEQIHSISPSIAHTLVDNTARIETTPLPRIFGVFFNQSRAAVFTNREVRRALELSVDKLALVEEVLGGYGNSIDGPLPPSVASVSLAPEERGFERAQELLAENNWKEGEDGVLIKKTRSKEEILSFTLATANIPELRSAAEEVVRVWEALGATVTLQLFDSSSLNRDVIRPREYDALLFGQIIGSSIDPFPFWHSSQRNDPGLNIALYANITADKALEDLRTTQDSDTQHELLETFENEVREDAPAVFLYAPDFIYVVRDNLKGLSLGSITVPSDRFIGVHEWYVQTDRIWNLFGEK